MGDFAISPRLATFTLVHVLKGQELYTRALDVLDILEKKGENKERIAAERDSIKSKFCFHFVMVYVSYLLHTLS